MSLKVGGLCFGYGGLEMGLSTVVDTELAWYSEVDKGACKIAAHRWPGVPNLGDMTAVDWTQVEPVDVLTGGTPCQDLSHAGKRAGMTEGTRSNLWVAMREAIAVLRPSLVVWENVGGAASAEADSDLERDPRLLAGVRRRPGQPLLRALGRVVGDLSSLGYVGQVRALRAADVGAPHGRLRYFLAAYPEGDARWFQHGDGSPAADAERGRRDGWSPNALRRPLGRTAAPWRSESPVVLLSTPQARDGKGVPGDGFNNANLARDVSLLPTPAVNDMGEGKTVEAWDAWTARMKAEHGNGNGHGASLAIEAQRLLPTPTTMDSHASGGGYNGQSNVTLTDATARQPERWGDYAAAIHRWEALTRPAPTSVVLSESFIKRRRKRLAGKDPRPVGMRGSLGWTNRWCLNPALSEWMMGLPAGHVTDAPDITRNEALKALGNGVVPQQAAAALADMLAAIKVAA